MLVEYLMEILTILLILQLFDLIPQTMLLQIVKKFHGFHQMQQHGLRD
jgi:hypothetical protein